MTLQQYMLYIYRWNPNRHTIIKDIETRERISWNDIQAHMNRYVLHIYPNETSIVVYLGDELEE